MVRLWFEFERDRTVRCPSGLAGSWPDRICVVSRIRPVVLPDTTDSNPFWLQSLSRVKRDRSPLSIRPIVVSLEFADVIFPACNADVRRDIQVSLVCVRL